MAVRFTTSLPLLNILQYPVATVPPKALRTSPSASDPAPAGNCHADSHVPRRSPNKVSRGIATRIPTFDAARLSCYVWMCWELPRGFPRSARLSLLGRSHRPLPRGFPRSGIRWDLPHKFPQSAHFSHRSHHATHWVAATGFRHADSHARRGFLNKASVGFATQIPTVDAAFPQSTRLSHSRRDFPSRVAAARSGRFRHADSHGCSHRAETLRLKRCSIGEHVVASKHNKTRHIGISFDLKYV